MSLPRTRFLAEQVRVTLSPYLSRQTEHWQYMDRVLVWLDGDHRPAVEAFRAGGAGISAALSYEECHLLDRALETELFDRIISLGLRAVKPEPTPSANAAEPGLSHPEQRRNLRQASSLAEQWHAFVATLYAVLYRSTMMAPTQVREALLPRLDSSRDLSSPPLQRMVVGALLAERPLATVRYRQITVGLAHLFAQTGDVASTLTTAEGILHQLERLPGLRGECRDAITTTHGCVRVLIAVRERLETNQP